MSYNYLKIKSLLKIEKKNIFSIKSESETMSIIIPWDIKSQEKEGLFCDEMVVYIQYKLTILTHCQANQKLIFTELK